MVFSKETSFTKRLKTMLKLYEMSASQLQEYCNVIYSSSPFYKGAMSYWINGTREPKNEDIIRIADFFAVSHFWLKGSEDYSDRYVYDVNFSSLEEWFFEHNPELTAKIVSEDYLKPDVRKAYPAEARANIIFLFNMYNCEKQLIALGKPPKDTMRKIRYELAPERIKKIIETKTPLYKIYG